MSNMLSISVIIFITCLSNLACGIGLKLLKPNNIMFIEPNTRIKATQEEINVFLATKHAEFENVDKFETNLTNGGDLCGISNFEAYLTPPQAVQDVISWAFGTAWAVGPLPGDGPCAALHEYTKNIPMAYVSVEGGYANKLITNKADSDKKKRERCTRKGGSCPSPTLAENVKNNVHPQLPVCMALSPCRGNSRQSLGTEATFGIHSGGDGLPIFSIYGITLYLTTLVFSSYGGLTVPPFDPPLLNDPKLLGAHFFLEGKLSFPIKSKAKEIMTVQLDPIAIGAYGRFTDTRRRVIDSPFQLMSKLFSSGLEPRSIAKELNSINSCTLQLYGRVTAEIVLKIGTIIGKSGVGDLKLDSSASFMLDFTAKRSRNKLDVKVKTYFSLRVSANLKDLFSSCGKLKEIVPGMNVQMDARLYLATGAVIQKSFFSDRVTARIDLHVFIKASVSLDCGVIREAVKLFQTLIDRVGRHVNIGPIRTIVNHLNRIVNSICGKTISAEFSLAIDNGAINRDKTYIGFNGNKLKLSDLPTCPPNANVNEPCSSNRDCSSNYCLNHRDYKSSIACQGRCIAKLGVGQDCSASGANLPLWSHADAANAENNICKSNSCLCGTCGPVINGEKCATNANCASGWCEGSVTADCRGVCRARKPQFSAAWKTPTGGRDGASCHYQHKIICTICADHNARVLKNQKCSTNANCGSGRCKGSQHCVNIPWWLGGGRKCIEWPTVGCNGRCQ